MKLKRLLLVTTVPVTLRAFLLPFAHHFRACGWRVDAMSNGVSACAECVQAFDRVWEVDWSRNPLEMRNLLQASQQVAEVVEREKYDLVHVHTPVAAFLTRYALRHLQNRIRPQIVYTAHGFHFYRGGSLVKNAMFLVLEKLAGRWTDYLVVINREDEEAAKRYHIVSPERVHYMPGIGVDTEEFSPMQVPMLQVERVQAELGLRADQTLFLMIAEFSSGKRHRDALLAFARLGCPTAHLAFAGVGQQMTEVQDLARKLGIANRVHFLGFRRDIPALIRASTATLLTSGREGLPRSVMESLSLEVPVIGTDIRGVRDLLEQRSGLLVRVGDVEDLARAMTWVLENPGKARAMGRRGRERMEVYDLRRIIAQHEALYAEALKDTACPLDSLQ